MKARYNGICKCLACNLEFGNDIEKMMGHINSYHGFTDSTINKDELRFKHTTSNTLSIFEWEYHGVVWQAKRELTDNENPLA